jgi:hypothetical protein
VGAKRGAIVGRHQAKWSLLVNGQFRAPHLG